MQEYELGEMKQANTVLFFVNDKRVQDDLKREKEKKEGGRKSRCLKVVGKYLQEKQVPGGTRLRDAADGELNKGVLRFKAKFDNPKEGSPWVWELVLTSTCPSSVQEAVVDMDQDGGCAGLQIRRPSQRLGPLAAELEGMLYPQRAADRVEWKGKAKGKGKGKGKGQGKGKGKDKDVDMVPPAMAPPGGVPPVAAGTGTAAASSASGLGVVAPAAAAAAAPAAAAAEVQTYAEGAGVRTERSRSPSGPRAEMAGSTH
jgi:hypothetical protein